MAKGKVGGISFQSPELVLYGIREHALGLDPRHRVENSGDRREYGAGYGELVGRVISLPFLAIFSFFPNC